MKFKTTDLNGLLMVSIDKNTDERGFFERNYCFRELKSMGITKKIMQINHSMTHDKYIVRGMHYQLLPCAETKIVRCLRGAVFDVAIDIRRDSPTFKKWHGEILTATNRKMMIVPEGFAHGLQTLENNCEVMYFNTAFYNKNKERCIRYDEPLINIKWPLPVDKNSYKGKNMAYLPKNFAGVLIN